MSIPAPRLDRASTEDPSAVGRGSPAAASSGWPRGLRTHGLLAVLLAVVLITAAVAPAAAQTEMPPQPPAADQAPRSFWEILRASGPIGLVILLLSVAAVALMIDQHLALRAKAFLPPGLADELAALLRGGQLQQAHQRCQQSASPLARVVAAGIEEVDAGWHAVEKGVEDALAEQSARTFRRIEYLALIGNTATLVGLLGTVVGLILAFREVADTQGAARAADLARGIYLALVTTVEGLTVAIPSLAAFTIFRNRLDQRIAEVAHQASQALLPLKRARPRSASAAPLPPPPPPDSGQSR